MEVPKYFRFWAKTDRSGETDQTHLLVYHMLDVGVCTQALWNHGLCVKTQETFAHYLQMDTDSTGRLLAFWASLHDLGKAAPVFQQKYSLAVPLLQQAGFTFSQTSPRPAAHGLVSAWALEQILRDELGYSIQIAKKVARAVGGHHGIWPGLRELQALDRQIGDTGDELWYGARCELVNAVRSVFNPPGGFGFPTNQQEENSLLVLFSGLVSVADWIGSMSEFFPFESRYHAPDDYARHSVTLAGEALHRLGWIGWKADGQRQSFTELFPSFSPRDIQQAVIDTATDLSQPALLILEAPTGCGKTEAALYLADAWLQANRGHGIYIAMPTQATSNQMFGRVETFLANCYPQDVINYHLVHGGALLANNDLKPNPVDVSDDESLPQAGAIRAQSWFFPRKRTLLAPFGVGTVDQALLSVLQTRHFFVRLFGLGQKVLVFDEVHAYDTYMSTLFERLLSWLHTIGTSVIVLSATLPENTRRRLVAAWLEKRQVELPAAEYPRLTFVSGESPSTVELPAPEPRSLEISWIDGDPQNLVEHLAERLSDGGCAAIICNRVARAQGVYQVIQNAGVFDPQEIILFHARYPFNWRMAIEERVLGLVSKGSQRPHRAVIVATQVIEQSLDLDFDYIVSDLAPIDLLIQRAGRLHRHSQNDERRPVKLGKPVLAINCPGGKEGLPFFGRDEYVYERVILLKTWLALHDRKSLCLPAELSGLIESVYGEGSLSEEQGMSQELKKAAFFARKEHEKSVVEANRRLVPVPGDEEMLYARYEGLEEEDPDIHDAFRALTRLSDPSVSLVCLHRAGDGITSEPGGEGIRVALETRPDWPQISEFLQHVVQVQRSEVVKHFVSKGEHPAWREVSALRYHYPVIFDESGLCHLEGTNLDLYLSRDTGLEIR